MVLSWKRLMIIKRLFLILIFSLLASSVWAGSIAFYSGSFDPLTQAHEAIIRAAANEPGVDKLYIIVNLSGGKNYNVSGWERTDMLEEAFADLKGKIQIVRSLQEKKEERIVELAAGNPIITVIGEDSYAKLPPASLNRANTSWIVYRRIGQTQDLSMVPANVQFRSLAEITEEVSSSLAREEIQNGKMPSILSEPVKSFIQRKQLYVHNQGDENVQALNESLLNGSFLSFKNDLILAFPEFDFSNLKMSPIVPGQSSQAIAESFIRQAISAAKIPNENLETFWKQATDMLFSFPRNQPKAQLSFIENVNPEKIEEVDVIKEKRVSPFRLGHPNEYKMNIVEYAHDRFAASLVEFLNNKKVKIFLHDGFSAESAEYHRRQGFDTFYRVRQIKSLESKPTYLAYSQATGEYRLLLIGLVGKDRHAQVRSQINAAGFRGTIIQVDHSKSPSLFQLTPEGQNLKLKADDLVIIGFKNRIQYRMANKGWKRTNLTSEGLDMTVMTHPDGRQTVLIKNVYGDETNTVLEYLKSRQARNIIYLGTAGGLNPNYKVGDVVLPKDIQNKNKFFSFQNNDSLLGNIAESGLQIHTNTRHGWVQTLLTETTSYLQNTQASGIDAIDIETRYFAQFLKANKRIKGSSALIVSDLPLGDITYDEHEATMKLVDDTLEKLLSTILKANEVRSSMVKSCFQFYSVP